MPEVFTRSLLLAPVLALITAGCTGESNIAAPLSGPAAPVSATTTPDDTAKAAAVTTIKRFYEVWGRLEASQSEPVEAFVGLASGPMLKQAQGVVLRRRSEQIRGTGAIRVDDAATKFPAAGIPLDKQGKPASGTAWVQVRMCTDMSGWHLHRKDGSSADDPRPRQRVAALYTVTNVVWPQPHGWRITGQSEAGYPPCDGER